MKNQKVIICKGLPASGKDTWAEEIINQDSSYIRINKDMIRKMLFDDNYKPKKEKLVIRARNNLIELYLINKKSIIITDTNLHPRHERRIKKIVENHNELNNSSVQVEIKEFIVDLETCVKRDLKRLNSVGRDVIENMYYNYIKPYDYIVSYNKALQDCIIVDLDGTLAINRMVEPYKYNRPYYNPSNEDVFLDLPNYELLRILNSYLDTSNFGINKLELIFLSGRENTCREGTIKWLLEKCLFEPEEYNLYMRENKDNRPDTIVKKEIYDIHIKDKYNVLSIFDDRPCVIDMWRNENLYVFDCNQRGYRF